MYFKIVLDKVFIGLFHYQAYGRETILQKFQRDRLCGMLNALDKQRVVVLCHGFSTSKNSTSYSAISKALNDKGISTFRFDFYGHGESEGRFEDITTTEAVDDALCAIKFMKERGYTKIGLLGGSFGGLTALIAASRSEDIEALALKSPVSNYMEKYLAPDFEEELQDWRNKGYRNYRKHSGEELKLSFGFFEDQQKNDGYIAAKKIGIPTLIVHGDMDEIVPVQQSIKTSGIIKKCRLEIIKGADHRYTNPEHFDRMAGLLADFLVQTMK